MNIESKSKCILELSNNDFRPKSCEAAFENERVFWNHQIFQIRKMTLFNKLVRNVGLKNGTWP